VTRDGSERGIERFYFVFEMRWVSRIFHGPDDSIFAWEAVVGSRQVRLYIGSKYISHAVPASRDLVLDPAF
jgi:hypothetical protein